MDLETIHQLVGKPRMCRMCDGTGGIPAETCPVCRGDSRLKGLYCGFCGGWGVLYDPCPECGGSGRVWE